MAYDLTPPPLRIRCAVCDRLVQRWQIDEIPSRPDRGRVLTVFCHGDSDAMTISDHDIASDQLFWQAVERGQAEGVAFATKRLEAAA